VAHWIVTAAFDPADADATGAELAAEVVEAALDAAVAVVAGALDAAAADEALPPALDATDCAGAVATADEPQAASSATLAIPLIPRASRARRLRGVPAPRGDR